MVRNVARADADNEAAINAFWGAGAGVLKVSFIRSLLRVKFETVEQAERAIEKSGSKLGSNVVTVEYELKKSKRRSGRGGSGGSGEDGAEGGGAGGGVGRRRTTAEEGEEEAEQEAPAAPRVWVGGLPVDATEDSVKALFKGYAIVSVELSQPRKQSAEREGAPYTPYAFGACA